MPLFKIFISFLVLSTMFYTCMSTSTSVQSKKVFKNGVNMLYGEISPDELFAEYASWKEIYNKYIPDENIISDISSLSSDIEVEIFLGTWCGDSRREVPRFLKIADQCLCIPINNIKIWAVDRDKSLESGLAKKKNIRRVATFIFLKDGNEIGRIVERPKNGSLEKDLYEILKG